MLLKRHLEVEPSPGHLKILENRHGGKGGASAPHIQRYVPIAAVQKSTPLEAKIFRDFHSQMQFSLNKLHFPDEKAQAFHRRLRRRQKNA